MRIIKTFLQVRILNVNEDDDDFPPNEDFKCTNVDSGDDEGTNNDNNNFPPSEDFNGTNDDFGDKVINNDDNDFPPSECFKGIGDDNVDEDFPPSGEFSGTNSVHDDVDLSSSEEIHIDMRYEDNHFPTKVHIPLIDENYNESDDGHSKEDDIPPCDGIVANKDVDIPKNKMEEIHKSNVNVSRTKSRTRPCQVQERIAHKCKFYY